MKALTSAARTQATVKRMLEVASKNPELIPSDLATRFSLDVTTVRRRLREAGIKIAAGRSERTGQRR
jgi:hypothetical protein